MNCKFIQVDNIIRAALFKTLYIRAKVKVGRETDPFTAGCWAAASHRTILSLFELSILRGELRARQKRRERKREDDDDESYKFTIASGASKSLEDIAPSPDRERERKRKSTRPVDKRCSIAGLSRVLIPLALFSRGNLCGRKVRSIFKRNALLQFTHFSFPYSVFPISALVSRGSTHACVYARANLMPVLGLKILTQIRTRGRDRFASEEDKRYSSRRKSVVNR